MLYDIVILAAAIFLGPVILAAIGVFMMGAFVGVLRVCTFLMYPIMKLNERVSISKFIMWSFIIYFIVAILIIIIGILGGL